MGKIFEKKSWNQQEPYKTMCIVNEPHGNNGKWRKVLLTQCKVKMWPISSNKYIFHCFAQVSAIRKAKLITFSKTDSQILFADFVVSSIMKQFTVSWNTVNNYINLNLSKGFYKKTWVLETLNTLYLVSSRFIEAVLWTHGMIKQNLTKKK